MPFDVIPEDELTDRILAIFFNVAKSQDRSGDIASERHHQTGLPVSANDLLARHLSKSGKALALELIVRPEGIAAGLGRRQDSTNPRGVSLSYIAEQDRTEVEREWLADLSLQIKYLVHKLNERHHWFNLSVQGGNPDKKAELLEWGHDNFTRAFQVTYEGLREAFERIPGTKYALAPSSIKGDISGAAWASAPQWAKDEQK